MPEFRGVLPAIITPMTEQGRLNEAAFRAVMEFNIQAGVHGFWVAGGTGESVFLDDEENMRIAEIAADQVRGRAMNIMHVGTPTTTRSARLAEHAARSGANAICCVPPFFYPPTDAEVVEHYRTVAAAADLPFFVYNLPQCTGTEITLELMHRIQEQVPQLTGLKHSAPSFGNVSGFVAMGLTCLIGDSNLMLPALTEGAVGCIDGPPNAAPELWVEIWQAFNAGDVGRAQKAQRQASKVTNLIREFGLHATTKLLVGERLGIDCGEPRRSLLPLTASQRKQVLARFAQIDLPNIDRTLLE
ncbi:MAG: dihydrodipicolinate synthase family protein [Gammaproteobacteria bacterium]